MELTGYTITVNVNGYQYMFKRDNTTKKWTFLDKSVTVKHGDLDSLIKTMQDVVNIINILDNGASEVDTLNNIASNFAGNNAA